MENTMMNKVKIKLRSADSLSENTLNIPFLDMAITFQISVPEIKNEIEYGESNIVNYELNYELANKCGISAQELYLDVLDNEVRNNPAIIETIGDRIAGLMGMPIGLSNEGVNGQLYVATNKEGVNGASVILYPNFLRDFGNKMGESFYILPSSIHEVILVPESLGAQAQVLIEMVKDVNRIVVAEDEVLSDNVYLYDLENDEIKIAT